MLNYVILQMLIINYNKTISLFIFATLYYMLFILLSPPLI